MTETDMPFVPPPDKPLPPRQVIPKNAESRRDLSAGRLYKVAGFRRRFNLVAAASRVASWRPLLVAQLSPQSSPAATNPGKDASIRTAKIRRIRVDQRAIGMHNSPRINADAADLRGSRRKKPFQKSKDFRVNSIKM